FGVVGNETAAGELAGQVEVLGQSAGLFNQQRFNLDPAGVELGQRGQSGDHAEAASPFAEQSAGRQSEAVDRLQRQVRHSEIAGDEGGNRPTAAGFSELV